MPPRPFDYGMDSRLVALAEESEIDFAVNVYSHYASDVAVTWKAGSSVWFRFFIGRPPM